VTRTVAFALHQPQDYVLSAGYARLLRRRAERAGAEPARTLGLVLTDALPASVAPHAEELDAVRLLGSAAVPAARPAALLQALRRLRAFRRAARALGLGADDVLVAYSYREFALNVLIRALPRRPTLVRVRKCDHETEAGLTRRRPLRSLYLNAWNTLVGAERLRYRWFPTTDRLWAGTFVHDPYDLEFCVGPPGADPGAGRWVAYPFEALLDGAQPGDEPPTIVVVGELYPLHEALDEDDFRTRFNAVLAHLRAEFPGHRLVFKPRRSVEGLGFDLEGYEVTWQDALVEELLLREPSIEKVLSVKSTGSALASLYGREAYLLYPMFGLPADFEASLDAYFAPYRGSVAFVERLDEIGSAPRRTGGLEQLERDTEPLLDALAGAI
jgi:hypothetical protein